MGISAIIEWDRHAFLWVNHNWGFTGLDEFMMLVSNEKSWLAFGLLFFVFCWFYKNTRLTHILWVAGVTISITDLLCFRLIKPFLHRLRPCYQMDMVRLLENSCGSNYGFPSNHAANSMAVIIVVLCLTRNWKWGWLLMLPFIVGISRVYVGVHYPLDVLFGFVVGGGVALLVSSLFIWKQSEILRFLSRVRRQKAQ